MAWRETKPLMEVSMHQAATTKKLVIFDCDGVLVDSEHLSNQALIDCLSEVNIEMKIDEAFNQFKGRNLADCFTEIEKANFCSLPKIFETNFRQRRSEYFESRLQPINGIEWAVKKIPHAKCVASNGPHQMIKRNLELAGLTHHFGESIFSAYTIQKWKPEPDLFLYACKEMGAEPENCIVVEDSEVGVAAAQAGGFKVLAFGFQPTLGGDAISFNEMSELPDLVEQIFSTR
jgi:HAD superfamily hydrolase (TIGR01509 family)